MPLWGRNALCTARVALVCVVAQRYKKTWAKSLAMVCFDCCTLWLPAILTALIMAVFVFNQLKKGKPAPPADLDEEIALESSDSLQYNHGTMASFHHPWGSEIYDSRVGRKKLHAS
jgi:hypothetical protein